MELIKRTPRLFNRAPILLLMAFAIHSTEAQEPPFERVIQQEEGGVVYWVLPGPRQLDPEVFGSPEDPKMLLRPKLQSAANGYPPSVSGLLQELPILVGVPAQARQTTEDGQVFAMPNPFSNRARVVSGNFRAELHDRVKEDQPLPPTNTPDSAEMTAAFTDPAGNEYRVVLRQVVQPPYPGYETEGGVMINGLHHGATGTGTPLMPEVATRAAFWGMGEIFVNDQSRGMRAIHLMTTEVVRDTDYRLVSQDELPLEPEERHIGDQASHTHLMVFPVSNSNRGPVYSPAPTAFELPNGNNQPFMHIMFEQDKIIN